MTQTLYIMQGAPGSGKSFVAKMIAERIHCVICSTDDMFYENEKYVFRPEKLSEYHAENLRKAKNYINAGYTVIVDNTNIQAWQCREYVKYAVARNIPVVFIRVTGEFQNTHGVPQDKVEAMRISMETLTLETVLTSKTPWELATDMR